MIQSVRMAIKSISGNKMRAFLTMLGIIIGVMALVILVSLVSGATGNVTDTIARLGSDQITVRISDNKGAPVTIGDLSAWMEEEAFGRIAPVASESVTAKYGTETGTMTVYGTTAPYKDIQKLNVLVGRFLKMADEENVSFVCVVNETAATELVGYADCLGEDIRLNGQRFRVVGVLKDDDTSLTSVFRSGSMVAYIPHAALVRLSASVTREITSFYVSAAADGTVIAASYSSSMGNYVMIDHGGGLYTIYMHASALYVSQGQSVTAGTQIAAVGSTGNSTGPHLHFSVRLNGQYVSPWQYLGS